MPITALADIKYNFVDITTIPSGQLPGVVLTNGAAPLTGDWNAGFQITVPNFVDSALTPGSVVFAGTAGLLSQDNANLFWDGTNKRLGIGTTGPNAALEVSSANGILISGAGQQLLFNNNTGTAGKIYRDLATGNLYLHPQTNLIIDQGNVGIGTAGPVTPLEVAGTIRTSSGGSLQVGNVTIGSDGSVVPRLLVSNPSDADKYVGIGYDNAGDYGFIHAVHRTTAWKNLVLQGFGGNVGIGTTSPAAKLDVQSGLTSTTSLANRVLTLRSNASGADTTLQFSDSVAYNAYLSMKAGDLTWYDNSAAAKVTFQNGGNVGIGTTAPASPLEVSGGGFAAARIGFSGTTQAAFTFRGTPDGTGWEHAKILGDRDTTSHAYGSFLAFYTEGKVSGTTDTSTEKMRIMDSGNVGIGTTSPPSKLSVAGTIEITAGSGGVLKFADGTSQASAAAGGGTVTGTGTATNVAFWTAGSTISSDNGLFWDNANKRLGVGLNSPGVTLQVAGPARITDAGATGSTGASYCQIFNSVGQIYVGVNDHANTFFAGSGADAACLYAAGALNLVISTAATPRMAFTGANTGIGASYIAPGSVLDIKDNAATCLRLSGSTSGFVGLRPAAVAGSTTYQLPAADSTGTQYLRSNGAGVLTWGTPAGAGTVTTNGSLSAGMVTFIDPAGSTVITGEGNLFYDNLNNRLGILTSSPLAPLHVGAQTNAPVSLTPQILVDVAGSSYIVAKDTSDVTEAAFGADSTGAIVGSQTSSPLNFQTAGVTRAIIPAAGGFRLNGATSGYTGLQAAAVAGSTTFTLPSADGFANQVLRTNGSGVLSFGAALNGIFDVTTYGAVADGKYVSDGAMTSGSTTLTSASNPWVPADAGKSISVSGAGGGGAMLYTTIQTYNGAGNVTLAAANSSGGNISGKVASWGTDNTTAFTNALAAANSVSYASGVVTIPPSNLAYRISTHISIPAGVTLRGSHTDGPQGGSFGSILHAVEGAGSSAGTAFISATFNTTLNGIAILYPHQATSGTPIAFPFAIKGAGYCCIKNIFLHNAYQGIDLASETTNPYNGAFNVDGIWGQPMLVGIDVDQSADTSTIQNVHFWPFWSGESTMATWMHNNAIGIRFGRSDWQIGQNLFFYGYGTGLKFVEGARALAGPTGGTFTNVLVDACKYGIDSYSTGFQGVNITGLTVSGALAFDGYGIRTNYDATKYSRIVVSQGQFFGTLLYGAYVDNNANGWVSLAQCQHLQNSSQDVYVNRGDASITGNRFVTSFASTALYVAAAGGNVMFTNNQLNGCTTTVLNATTLSANNQ